MTRASLAALAGAFLVWAFGPVVTVYSDEGMWLFTNPPRELLQKKYNLDLSDAWLERVQKASVRFNNGGSGSFVSADGLVLTNHHIGQDSLQKLSTKERDLIHDGYYAATREAELKCPDLELNVLMSIEDVTERVSAAVKPGLSAEDAAKARRAVLADIEKESTEKTRLRSDVVTLYNGGLYHLYRYKKYTDVRLVFAPEQAIAFFGGDTDNFEFPRYNLDICFFRVYENGQPVKTPHYLKWSPAGPVEGEVVFVSGHPGTTNRLETLARLFARRDRGHPYTLNRLRNMEAALLQFSERGPENARQAHSDLHRVANARKAFAGQYQGLLDAAILGRKAQDEKVLRSTIQSDPRRKTAYADAWLRVGDAQHKLAKFEKEYMLCELADAFDCRPFRIARHLVRLAEEKTRPNAERLREYGESALESLELQLFSPAPIHPELERAKLAASLTFLAEVLGGAHPLVLLALDGKPPAGRAAALMAGTRLADPAERRRLAAGGVKAISESTDTMISFARTLDAEARKLRKRYEAEVEEVERQAYAQIARARFELYGTAIPPDATFTLRLAFGVVKGYRVEGEDLPFHTTFGGAFERAERQRHREPFVLPSRWLKNREKLDPKTPFNFVSTADTIGGNSGSPVINRAGELVGVNFDRNRHGLVRNFVYTEEQARHIAVHSRGILEALRVLYETGPLVRELVGR